MHDTSKGEVFLLVLGLCATLVMGAPDRVNSHGPVKDTSHGGRVGYEIALKAPLIEESDTHEKAEQPRLHEEKKTVPPTGREKPTAKEKTDPVKKFVPSEKIPADQAVDFPADI